MDWLYAWLENGRYPFISQLRARGRTLVLVGFDERSESILTNAETLTAAILRTSAEQLDDARLMVGGFSMGGIVARYALAKMETQRIDHRTGVYVSFDSPHRGGWVPIGLQAFAHYLAKTGDDTYLQQISSAASQQMLWRYLDALDGTPAESPLRTRFKEQLQKVGSWPQIPRLIGVSSGRGDGVGNGVEAGKETLSCAGPLFEGTRFLAQSQGKKAQVAVLNGVLGGPHTITTDSFPELDGAPAAPSNRSASSPTPSPRSARRSGQPTGRRASCRPSAPSPSVTWTSTTTCASTSTSCARRSSSSTTTCSPPTTTRTPS
ncbi:esterase/lipase family protein [Streptomyces zaomyceticus]|uniref:esterase/lipase family protein n=1 Tax=Streptomyces zaomyceticus TaxID=68286 RepID=UPI0036617625